MSGTLRVKSLSELGKHVKVAGKVTTHRIDPKAKQKYGNEKTDGFDSKREADHFAQLVLRQKAGEIADLKTQVPFDLCVNGFFIGKFTADFTWVVNGKTIVADAKGVRTRDYILRKKLMRAIWGVEIVEL